MYNVLQISRFIINLCYINDSPISCNQLQIILYYAQIFYMRANNGEALFNDDFIAVPTGPVIESIRRIYQGYGGGIIKNTYDCSDINARTSMIISPVILRLSKMNPWDLFDMVRKNKSPWDITYSNRRGFMEIIYKNLMVLDKTLEVMEEEKTYNFERTQNP